MRRSNLLIAFYLVLIFASGAAVGAFASRLYAPHSVSARMTPEEWRRNYTSEMQTRLSMSPDQMTRLNVILDETGAKVHGEHERHNREMKAIHDEQVNKTRAVLTNVQLPEYEKLRQDREERAKKSRAQNNQGR